ncbi:hypothetical protein [Chitinophaga varians]|uniref:hypothetical protein n=1 Tax=Chitinophaga varians TaxID=2202339 RepID=UPI00165F7944|nr:hypothetical protein [Chitinophaga varians]MBC9909244.1 hypothetical protein [Chitinophaga varians]
MRCALFCWLLLLMACNGHSRTNSALFPYDSGYLRKREVLPFLAVNHLTDSSAEIWRDYDNTDILGKYYRLPAGNVIACLKEVGADSHWLLEINSYDSVLRKERYFHGMYPACWDGFDGFTKTGDCYFLKICGTGSGFSSSNVYVFRHVTAQDSLHHILEAAWSRQAGEISSLTSIRELKSDTLRMYYTLIKWRDEEDIPILGDTARFAVTYVNDRRGWHALDSTFLNSDIPN